MPDPSLDPTTLRRLEARAGVLRAMAHPTRLFLVEHLARGERCVCELTEMVGADMSTVSRHLSQLRQEGIVDAAKRGQKVFYRLRATCVLRFFDCIEAVMNATGSEVTCCGVGDPLGPEA